MAEEGGPHQIRVNTVNPDAVIQGSSIWSSDWKAERASTYGVSEDELQAFYDAAFPRLEAAMTYLERFELDQSPHVLSSISRTNEDDVARVDDN